MRKYLLLLPFLLISCIKDDVDTNCGYVYSVSKISDDVYKLFMWNPNQAFDRDDIYVVDVVYTPLESQYELIDGVVCLCDLEILKIYTWNNSIDHFQEPHVEIYVDDYCEFELY